MPETFVYDPKKQYDGEFVFDNFKMIVDELLNQYKTVGVQRDATVVVKLAVFVSGSSRAFVGKLRERYPELHFRYPDDNADAFAWGKIQNPLLYFHYHKNAFAIVL